MSSFNLILVFPNSLIAPVPDGALLLLFFPEGPHRTQVRINLLYPESTKNIPDYEENVALALKGFEDLNYQDMWPGLAARTPAWAPASPRPEGSATWSGRRGSLTSMW